MPLSDGKSAALSTGGYAAAASPRRGFGTFQLVWLVRRQRPPIFRSGPLNLVIGLRAREIVGLTVPVACLVAAMFVRHRRQRSQHRRQHCSTVGGAVADAADWLSIIIGIDEPTSGGRLPCARFIGDCEVILACSHKCLTV